MGARTGRVLPFLPAPKLKARKGTGCKDRASTFIMSLLSGCKDGSGGAIKKEGTGLDVRTVEERGIFTMRKRKSAMQHEEGKGVNERTDGACK